MAAIMIDVVPDPCPTCRAPIIMVPGDGGLKMLAEVAELFAVGGPPHLGGEAHLRPHRAGCADRSGSAEHPDAAR